MYILYLDESGNPDNPEDRHFVLAGVAVFERVTYFLSQAVDQVQSAHLPGLEPLPFHAAEMRAGKGFWRKIEAATRLAILHDLAKVLADANRSGVVLFAAAVEKNAACHGEEAVKRAAEEICRRFDIYLKRLYRERDDPQRGLLVFADSSYRKRHRLWVREFRQLGTRWGAINNLSDIPYFAEPAETRPLQLADLISHATFLLYERRKPELMRALLSRFDQKNGVLHGLMHVTADDQCGCPACASRRSPGDFGDWCAEAPDET